MKNVFTHILNFIKNNRLLTVAILVIVLVPSFAHAGIVESIQTGIIEGVLKPIVYGLGSLLIFLINLLSYLFEYNDFLNVPVVNQGWIVVRDLLNMTFVLMMMMMAIGTILPFGPFASYNYKSTMLKLLLAAITINFSKVILGVVIDACQIVMLQFVSSFREAIAVNLADGALLPQILETAKGGDVSLLATIISLIAAIIFLLIFVAVLFIYAIVLLYRIIALWIIIMMSPIMFFAQVGGPMLAGVAKDLWSRFWSQVTIGITLAFFMWLALMVMYMTDTPQSWMSGDGGGQIVDLNAQTSATNEATGATDKNVCSSTACEYYNILRFIVAIIVLMQALQYAQKSGGFVGKMAGNISGKISALGTGALGGFGAAKFLKKRGKEFGKNMGKKAWGGAKTLGSTAWQTTGGRATTALKNKLGTEGAKGVGLGAAGLALSVASGGVIPGVALAGYGAAKAFKQLWKNGKKQTDDRRAAVRNAKGIEAKSKGMYLDKNGAESSKENAYAEWNKDKQGYYTKEKKFKEAEIEIKEGEEGFDPNNAIEKQRTVKKKFYYSAGQKIYEGDPNYSPSNEKISEEDVQQSYRVSKKTKKVYEGEVGYNDLKGKEEIEASQVILDANGKTRQRFASFDDYTTAGKQIKRRYDENSKKFRKVQDNGMFDNADKGIELEKEGPGAIASTWSANKSKFIASTDKAKQEEVDKGVARMDSLDVESLKKLVNTSGSSDNRKFAALALAKKGEELDNDTLAAAKKAVGDDAYASKQFEKSMGAAGNTDQFKDKSGNIDIDKLVAAIKKGEVKTSELKASQLNTQVLEAVFRQFGKGANKMFDDISKDVVSKNKVNDVLRNYAKGADPNLPNKENALGQYAKRTGNYISDGNGPIMTQEQATKFFKDNGGRDVLASVTIDQINLPEMTAALQNCKNAALFSNFFRNEDISSTIKEKVAEVVSQCNDADFVKKIRKGPSSAYFKGYNKDTDGGDYEA